MNRRRFLKFAGLASAVEFFFGKLEPALGQTWQKLGPVAQIASRVRLPQRGIRRSLPTIAAGPSHSIALRSDGLVFATGNNSQGRLGNNTIVNKSTYVQAVGISNAVMVASGGLYSVALRSDGLVFAAGGNGQGRLGDNTVANKSTFVQVVSP